MKRTIIILCAIMATTLSWAQPSAVKKAANAVFTLTTFDKNGSMKATTRGFFVGADGVAVSSWAPFVGASSAVVVDAKGNKYDVESLMGANELYDVCRFRTSCTKANALKLANNTSAKNAWVVGTAGTKPQALKVSKSETFMNCYAYYIFDATVADNALGSPVVDDAGAALGILQFTVNGEDVHSTDVAFLDTIALTGLSINNPVLSQSGIRVDLPKDKEQASLMLMMAAEKSDSMQYAKYVDAFIRQFPHAVDGYTASAQTRMAANDYDGVMNVMNTAVKNVSDKAAAYSELSRMIYQKVVFNTDTTFTKWTLDDAMSNIAKAIEIDPQPAYKHREAQIVFSKGDYTKAYDLFMDLTKTNIRSGELFYEAAQCKTQLKAPTDDVIALLDSALVACPKPLTNLSAPYVLSRAQLLDGKGQFRLALKDYNLYDSLMAGRANDAFYYARYQCEMKVKQYQQALNDIAHAAFINPRQPLYLAELASLQLRVNRLEDAVKAADLCLSIAPESTDAYVIKGIALIQLKKKEEGMAALQKAKELGDSRGEELMKKYK